jgi:hypothetical protein
MMGRSKPEESSREGLSRLRAAPWQNRLKCAPELQAEIIVSPAGNARYSVRAWTCARLEMNYFVQAEWNRGIIAFCLCIAYRAEVFYLNRKA